MHLGTAQHRGLGSSQLFERCDGAVGAPALYKANHRIEHHDHQNRQGVGEVTDQARHHSGGQQDQHHEVFELVRQQSQRAASHLILQRVGAVVCQSALGFRMGQTVASVHHLLIQQVFHFALIRRVWRAWLCHGRLRWMLNRWHDFPTKKPHCVRRV